MFFCQIMEVHSVQNHFGPIVSFNSEIPDAFSSGSFNELAATVGSTISSLSFLTMS